MDRDRARKELAENLILLAEALLDDENAGEYTDFDDKGELKITSVTRDSTTVVAIKTWGTEEEEWAEFIE